MVDILIEIGTEEIPASYLKPASQDFKNRVEDLLKKNSIKFREIEYYYTPRRLVIIGRDVEEQSERKKKRVLGPPERVSFKEGTPTKALLSFVKRYNKNPEDVEVVENEKGRYISLLIEEGGVSTDEIFSKNIDTIVRNIKFPKTMVWEENYRFARPVRWFVLMKDRKVIEAKIFNIPSSNISKVLRFSDIDEVEIESVDKYLEIMRSHNVIVSQNEREDLIVRRLKETAERVNGAVIMDHELLEEVVNIVEYPVPILCKYDEEFLYLPREVLVTALKYHQRAFSIEKDGKLLPYFIVMGNNPHLEENSVRVWYERMVRSRLNDAQFFFEEDKKIPLEKLVEEEKRVVWIEEIGTLYDKTMRIVSLATYIGDMLNLKRNTVERASYLSKADLLTNMVREKEYTSLQGIMGAIYARIQKEDEEVVKAIRDQYLPSGDDNLPETLYGAVLAMADRIDNITAAFITGHQPTGSEDPHGIRRQGIGVIQIMIGKKLDISLGNIIEKSLSLFNAERKSEIKEQIFSFFLDRVYNHIITMGYSYDTVRSVITLYGLNPYDSFVRVESISRFRERKEFEDMVIGQKRVVNILKGIEEEYTINKELLKEETERKLLMEAERVEPIIEELIREKKYEEVMGNLLHLRIFIDQFFDNVLVMTEDMEIRKNRMALLQYIRKIFFKMADFSHIVI